VSAPKKGLKARGKLLTCAEGKKACGQHKSPCSDCPWTRASVPGWLGDLSADEWLRTAHGEARIECHVHLGAQCAGAAIYRSNMAKRTHDSTHLRLPADRERVFATPTEFKDHHARIGQEPLPPPDVPRDATAEHAFEALANRVSEAAAAIKCSPEAYRDGLDLLIERLQTDRQASTES
jgi:hypothetical protein